MCLLKMFWEILKTIVKIKKFIVRKRKKKGSYQAVLNKTVYQF